MLKAMMVIINIVSQALAEKEMAKVKKISHGFVLNLCFWEAVVWSKALLVIYDSNRGESQVLTTPETGQKLRFSGVFNTDNVSNTDNGKRWK